MPANKRATKRQGEIKYRRPKNESDFIKARQCATSGLENIERAISLDPNNDAAWSYKANLLLELAKLAEMDGQLEQQLEYQRQADQAMRRNTKLREEKEKRP